MFDHLAITYVWFGCGLWAVAYCSDFCLTLIGQRLYNEGVNKHLEFKSYEVNPVHVKDVEKLRWLNPKLALELLIFSAVICLTWLLVTYLSWTWRWNVFRLVLGAFLIYQLALHVRHVQNIVLFHYARRSLGLRGTLHYSEWLSFRMSSVGLFSFGAVLLLLFLVTESWYLAGGAANCFLQSLCQFSYSFKPDPEELA